jgi:hypothetical protein
MRKATVSFFMRTKGKHQGKYQKGRDLGLNPIETISILKRKDRNKSYNYLVKKKQKPK